MSLYYGVGPVPKGKRRATLQEAKNAGQLRYYGEVAVSPAQLVPTQKKKVRNLTDEQLKLRKMQDMFGIWTKELKMLNLVINDPQNTPKKTKNAQKKKDAIIKRGELNKKKIAKQREIIAEIKREKNIV